MKKRIGIISFAVLMAFSSAIFAEEIIDEDVIVEGVEEPQSAPLPAQVQPLATSATKSLDVTPLIGNSGTVKATKLNVRALPSTKSKILGSFEQGDKVELRAKSGIFYEVALPAGTEIWLAGMRVDQKSSRTTGNLNMRTAPDTSSISLGILPKDSAIEIVDASKVQWIKVKAPAVASGYVAASYVDVDKDTLAKLPEKKIDNADAIASAAAAATTTATTAATVTASASAAVLAQIEKLKAYFEQGSTRNISLEGVVTTVNGAGVPAITHALMRERKGQYLLSAYLYTSKNIDLRKYNNRIVTISGVANKINGWNEPVVDVRSITEKK